MKIEFDHLKVGVALTVLAVTLMGCVPGWAETLSEANSKFRYKGKPIHPYLVKEFTNWLSDDRPPMIVAVDVAAATDSNRYQKDAVERRDKWWFASTEETTDGLTTQESFGYRWIGRLSDGTHALETGYSGGGSGFFMDLMLVRFSTGQVLVEGRRVEQLLMTIVGIHSLGDRYEGEIKIRGNELFVPASTAQHGGGSKEKDTVFTVQPVMAKKEVNGSIS